MDIFEEHREDDSVEFQHRWKDITVNFEYPLTLPVIRVVYWWLRKELSRLQCVMCKEVVGQFFLGVVCEIFNLESSKNFYRVSNMFTDFQRPSKEDLIVLSAPNGFLSTASSSVLSVMNSELLAKTIIHIDFSSIALVPVCYMAVVRLKNFSFSCFLKYCNMIFSMAVLLLNLRV